MDEADLLARERLPHSTSFTDGTNRGERVDLEFEVDFATTQIVDNRDVVTEIRQMQRRGPATETVAAENQYLHEDS